MLTTNIVSLKEKIEAKDEEIIRLQEALKDLEDKTRNWRSP